MAGDIWLIRHGETEWSKSGAHTGRTDLPLTDEGRTKAAAIGKYLAGHAFGLVLTSPLQRAAETCRIAGLDATAVIEPNLREWDYGAYEGRKTVDIRTERPAWDLWRDGVPNGEAISEVAARAQRVIERATQAAGDVALFAHGHLLRILTASWLGLEPAAGRLFALTTASISILGHERENRVITRWNVVP